MNAFAIVAPITLAIAGAVSYWAGDPSAIVSCAIVFTVVAFASMVQ